MRPAAVVIAFLGVAATLVIVAVASTPDDEPTAAPTSTAEAPTTTTAVTAADSATNEQIFAQANQVLSVPTIESVAALAATMGESGDPVAGKLIAEGADHIVDLFHPGTAKNQNIVRRIDGNVVKAIFSRLRVAFVESQLI